MDTPTDTQSADGGEAVSRSGEFYRVPRRDLDALVELAWQMEKQIAIHNRDMPSMYEAGRHIATVIARVARHTSPTGAR